MGEGGGMERGGMERGKRDEGKEGGRKKGLREKRDEDVWMDRWNELRMNGW